RTADGGEQQRIGLRRDDAVKAWVNGHLLFVKSELLRSALRSCVLSWCKEFICNQSPDALLVHAQPIAEQNDCQFVFWKTHQQRCESRNGVAAVIHRSVSLVVIQKPPGAVPICLSAVQSAGPPHFFELFLAQDRIRVEGAV